MKYDFENWEGIYVNLNEVEKDICMSVVSMYDTMEEFNAYFKDCSVPSRKLFIVIVGMMKAKIKNQKEKSPSLVKGKKFTDETIHMPRIRKNN